MIKILTNERGESLMYEDSTEIGFGPLFGDDEDPQDFIDWAKEEEGWYHLNRISDVAVGVLFDCWRKMVKENEEEARAERVMSDTEATTLDEQCAKAKGLK